MIANQILVSDVFRKQRPKIRSGYIRKSKLSQLNVPNEVYHGLANQMSNLSTYQSATELQKKLFWRTHVCCLPLNWDGMTRVVPAVTASGNNTGMCCRQLNWVK